jgi:hypothetical protein
MNEYAAWATFSGSSSVRDLAAELAISSRYGSLTEGDGRLWPWRRRAAPH